MAHHSIFVQGQVKGAQRRRERRRQRFARMRVLAGEMAEALGRRFDLRRVWLFGSLLHPEQFHDRSDVDLAVEGLSGDRYLSAWGVLEDIAGDIPFHLTSLEEVSLAFREEILREGVILYGDERRPS